MGGGQEDSYNDAVVNYSNDCRYMAFIDSDEFIFPIKNDQLFKMIESLKVRYEKSYFSDYCGTFFGGIGVNWRMYGTSGHKNKTKGLVIENYTKRAKDDYWENAHIKTIANPRTISACGVHNMKYSAPFLCIGENGTILTTPFFPDGRCEYLRINHYWSRSEEDMWEKFNRGWLTKDLHDQVIDEDLLKKRYQEKLDIINNWFNTVEDRSMDRFITRVKQKLENP